MENLVVGFVILALWLSDVEAYPAGAGPDACEHLMPGHGAQPQSEISSPYSLKLSVDSYTPGNSVVVTLLGVRSFKGFLLVASNSSTGNVTQTVGTLEAHIPTQSNLITKMCSVNRAISQSQILNRTKLLVRWNAPEQAVGTVTFHGTFIQDKMTYWVNLRSDPVWDSVGDRPVIPTAAPIGTLAGHVDLTTGNCDASIFCWSGCEPSDCSRTEHKVIWKKKQDEAHKFELEIYATNVKKWSYVAFGIAPAANMTNVTIVACIADDGTNPVQQFYAESQGKPVSVPNGVINASTPRSRYEPGTGTISCTLVIDSSKTVPEPEKWKNLAEGNRYSVFLARGVYYDGELRKHENAPLVYSEKVDFKVSTGSTDMPDLAGLGAALVGNLAITSILAVLNTSIVYSRF